MARFFDFQPDVNAQLKDDYLVAASAAAEVDGSAQVLDLWDTTFPTFTPFDVQLIVTAIETDTGDELYTVVAQVSNSATFASDVRNVGMLELGAAAAKTAGADGTDAPGEYVLRAHNDWARTQYRHLRLWTDVAGTIATGINYRSWLSLAR